MKTIKDVAAYPGVSLATVSWVVSNSDKTSSRTKAEVDQVIRELGYFPDNAARSLMKKQIDSTAIPLRNIHNPSFTDLIRGTKNVSATLGHSIIFCSPSKDEKARDRYIEYLTNGISDAIILHGSLFTDKTMVEYLQKVEFPLLLIENNLQVMPVNQFLIDNVAGARDAMSHPTHHNHGRIAHIMDNFSRKVILERFNDYIETMRDSSLLIQDYYIQNTLSNSILSLPKFREMMNRPKGEQSTTVFCGNDKVAIMVVNELTESEFEVPEDASVIGFDNLNMCGFSHRGLRIINIGRSLYQIEYDSIISIDGVLQGSIETPIDKFYPTTLKEHETVCPL